MVLLLLVVLAAVPVFAGNKDLVQSDIDQYDIEDRDYITKDRIIGGIPATIDEFPFIVSLHKETAMKFWNGTFQISLSKSLCGGTIITENWVLTAAHCVQFDRSSDLLNTELSNTPTLKEVVELSTTLKKLRAGSSYTYKGGVVRHVSKIVSHNYPPHDIALIKVDEPWPLNGITISVARLPRQDDPVPLGYPATIMGWGELERQGAYAESLMKQDVVIISTHLCMLAWNTPSKAHVTEAHVCTTFHHGKTPSHPAHGDSGGPLVKNGEVVGIVSFNHKYSPRSPDVYTRVSSYIDWIEEHVGPLPRAE